MFRLECQDNEGRVAAVAEVRGGALVVMGDLHWWREAAAELLPILRETAALIPSPIANRPSPILPC